MSAAFKSFVAQVVDGAAARVVVGAFVLLSILATGGAINVALGQEPMRGVAALGRIEPAHGIRRIGAGTVPEAGNGVLRQLLVDIGDPVRAGQLLAVLDTEAVLAARVEVTASELTLARGQAAASQSQADAACVRAGVAEREAERLRKLRADKLAAEGATDSAHGAAEASAADCTAARSAVKVAEVAIAVVQARLSRHQAELERARIKSPIDGRVLAVHARAGESVGPAGIVELGDVGVMYAIAEVFETDVRRLRVGQAATVTSNAFDAPLSGQIERIRPKVAKADQIGDDPAARKDARIVEVEIKLDAAAAAAGLTNLQVEIVFGPMATAR